MKQILRWGSLPLLILLLGSILSSYEAPSPLVHTRSVTETIKLQYVEDVEAFKTAVDQLWMASKDQPEQLAAIFKICRNRYKKIEYLAEYYDAEFVKKHINGAPLPRLSTDDNKMIEEPEGLQTLEELIFSEEQEALLPEIRSLTERLSQNVRIFVPFQHQYPMRHRFVFEASRSQLIRIFSLSLTGFDTPATLAGIQESQLSLAAVQQAVSLYFPLIQKQDPALRENLDNRFTGALSYLAQNQDFDNFDRLHFLTEYLNPLYAGLTDARKILGIPTASEATPGKVKFSLNPKARNLFDEDLLNPFYYTELISEQHTENTIELGRTLFFDPLLSDNLDRSCASCHHPEKAFTDGNKKSIARGFKGTVNRNAPTLINSAYSARLFLDLRAEKLEDQIHHVIFSEKEFNTNFFEIFKRIKQSPEYLELFKKAFPDYQDRPLHRYTLATALSSYIISIGGFSSPFDQYVKGERESLDPAVKRGFNLFMGKAACGTCHFAPTFSGLVPPAFHEMESEILGVPANKDPEAPVLDQDPGRAGGRVKEDFAIYHRSFKTTTVRNIALTAPYMHNGVYDNLEEVVDFYNRGGGAGMGLEVPHQTLPPDELNLTPEEIKDLVAFMESLTNEQIDTRRPERLPKFPEGSRYNDRKIGGEY